MIKYENTFIDGHRTEKDITLNGEVVGLLTTERAFKGYQQRFKGSLFVMSYSVIIHGHSYMMFYTRDYASARQALKDAKRYVKETLTETLT